MISKHFKNAKVVGIERNLDCIMFAKKYNLNDDIDYIQDDLFDFVTDLICSNIFFLERKY